jgi:threonine/homoserine/homoserine lactone efflux protein
MIEMFWHFFIGFIVSFLGSIPLGTVNLAVIQTSVTINFRAGFYFALGATLIELVYSAIAVKFIATLMNNTTIDLTIQIISIPAFLILGIIYYKKQNSTEVKAVTRKKSFYHGLFIGLINPMQIPFWIGYGSYLLSEKIIQNNSFLLNIFIAGICLGTLILLTLLALWSKKITDKLSLKTQFVNKFIAVILFTLAFYQMGKLTYKLI